MTPSIRARIYRFPAFPLLALMLGCETPSADQALTVRSSLLSDGGWAQVEVYGPGDSTAGWEVYDGDPPGAFISVVDDSTRGRVNQFSGSGTSNGYRLRKSTLAPWGNTTNFHLSWWMRFSGPFVVYVDVNTTQGQRYLNYTPDSVNYLASSPGYVHHGLGPAASDGAWHLFQRDLKADLRDADPSLTVLSVNGFLIRGSGLVDDITLSTVANPVQVYGSGETASGWGVYDADPPGATISVIEDPTRGSVMQMTGSGTENGYRLLQGNNAPWGNTSNFHISWWMRYSGPYVVYIDVNTSGGQRYLNYTADSTNHLGSVPGYVHHGLGPSSSDGFWHQLKRDLKADLADADPSLTLLSVNAFLIRGSGSVDDVILSWAPSQLPPDAPVLVYAEGTTTLGWDVYDADPAGAAVSVVSDPIRGMVNQVSGTGTSNGFRLRKDTRAPWGNSSNFNISWWMRYSSPFVVYIDVNTSGGQRYLNYTPDSTNHLASAPGYVHHGLGPAAADGAWHRFQRDLKADLRDAEPTLTLLSVNGFLVRGSGLIDDVTLQRAAFDAVDLCSAPNNPIVAENCRPGTTDWVLRRGSPNHEVEGYASVTSAAPGEGVELKVSVSAPQPVLWEAFRLGFYQDRGARLIASGSFNGIVQPACPVDTTTGTVECQWSTSVTVFPDTSWTTGQYVFRLTRNDGYQSHIPLVIREATPRAPLVMQASVTTYQAYNAWGGASLYGNDSTLTGFPGSRAYRVSFDRPYAGQGSGQLTTAEIIMLKWLEKKGYDLAYLTNIDVDTNPNLIASRRMFLSVGHDEYWTVAERDAVEAARAAGVSLGFFSANSAYWRVRLEPSSSATPRRIMTCYKDAALDPLGTGPTATVLFRADPFKRPENALLGVMYEGYAPIDGYPLRVTNPSHWIYAGTGVTLGETLPNIGGYEWDHVFDNGLSPAGLERVAEMVGVGDSGEVTPGHTVTYAPTASSIVFACGSVYCTWALGRIGYVDSRFQRMTENVLARAGLSTRQPTQVNALPPPVVSTSMRSTSLLAGDGVAGYQDGPAATARFAAPSGIAAHPNGTLFIAEARNHRVRALGADGLVTTVAGCGPTDSARGRFADGVGTNACFDVPTGLALGSNNTLYVSDTPTNTIREIDLTTKVVRRFAGAVYQTGFVDSVDLLSARFSHPRGLAMGPEGALYVADSANGAIRRINAAGVTTAARGLQYPTAVAVASDGTVYAAGGYRIFRVPRLNATEPAVFGPLESLAGETYGDQEGPAAQARLRPLDGMVIQAGPPRVLFSDSANLRVRALDLSATPMISTVAGTGRYGAGIGSAAVSELSIPRGLCSYRSGFAVADSGNNRVVLIAP